MRIAIIDVGTNTTRLFVADVDGDGRIDEVARESRVTRLGAGVDAGGRLSDEALEREHRVLHSYAVTIDEHQVDRTVAVMTSAVRDAANGEEFAAEVTARYGITAEILTGDQEAQLTYLGATDELDPDAPADGPMLVLDIGGGSTELVIGHGRRLDFHVSTQAGVVRQADRHIVNDPPTEAELDAVAQDVRSVLHAGVPPEWRSGIAKAIAVAGTPTSLASIAQELNPYDPAKVHGYRLTAAKRDELGARLAPMPLDERRQVIGLHPARALTIVPGIVILTEVMDLFGLDAVEVSEHDILRGAAVAYSR